MKKIKNFFEEYRMIIGYSIIIFMFLLIVAWNAYYESSLFLFIVLICVLGDLGYRLYRFNRKKIETQQQIKMITHSVNTAGENVFNNLPIGILLYNEKYEVLWVNDFAKKIFDSNLSEQELEDIHSVLDQKVKDNQGEFEIAIKERIYRVEHLPNEHILYLTDRTGYEKLRRKYGQEQAAMGVLMLDNYDESVRKLNEQEKNALRGNINSIIMKWAEEYQIYIRSIANDRYLLLMSNEILEELRENKFTIVDKVREAAKEKELTFTISIGLAAKFESFVELGQRANYMLDLALSRGGDQVAITIAGDEKFLFYGGTTNPVERRNRVRARVNAQAYERLIRDSDQVIIMGHRYPDVDVIGASIGLLRMGLACQKEAYIVLDQEEVDKTTQNFINEILKNESLRGYFISSEVALEKINKNSLLVIADTQDPKMVIEPLLLNRTKKIAIFDHHRRGANSIESVLAYTEPYASSTVELVVDMFDYSSQKIRMSSLEASIMLAGIIVDTRRFSYRTGRRTYETAAILKQKGAEERLVQQLLRTPIENFYSKAHLIERAEIFNECFLIATAAAAKILDGVQLAQAADELLNIQDIKATFAIGQIDDTRVGISARSLGDVNVQLLMEQLGGGGHLNNAATQISNHTIPEVVLMLKKVIEELDND